MITQKIISFFQALDACLCVFFENLLNIRPVLQPVRIKIQHKR